MSKKGCPSECQLCLDQKRVQQDKHDVGTSQKENYSPTEEKVLQTEEKVLQTEFEPTEKKLKIDRKMMNLINTALMQSRKKERKMTKDECIMVTPKQDESIQTESKVFGTPKPSTTSLGKI